MSRSIPAALVRSPSIPDNRSPADRLGDALALVCELQADYADSGDDGLLDTLAHIERDMRAGGARDDFGDEMRAAATTVTMEEVKEFEAFVTAAAAADSEGDHE
jgi:hypothetical protein